MRLYTVVGLYADNYQRWATTVEADTPAEAEQEAVSVHEVFGQVLVAGVLEGEHQLVDQDTSEGRR